MDVMVFSSEYDAQQGNEGNFTIKFDTQKSLDDEHTPGVFNVSLVMCFLLLEQCFPLLVLQRVW